MDLSSITDWISELTGSADGQKVIAGFGGIILLYFFYKWFLDGE